MKFSVLGFRSDISIELQAPVIKRYQDILFKLFTLSSDSVTKKITVVRTVYFYNPGLIFATKNFVTESVLKVKSFMRIPWHG